MDNFDCISLNPMLMMVSRVFFEMYYCLSAVSFLVRKIGFYLINKTYNFICWSWLAHLVNMYWFIKKYIRIFVLVN